MMIRAWSITSAIIALALALAFGGWAIMFWMPGASYHGLAPPLSEYETRLGAALRADVEMLAGTIGERNMLSHANLAAAADFLNASLTTAGYQTRRQSYTVDGKTAANIEVEIPGTDRAAEIVIIGAHYDSVRGGPGANDNASGVAALLALARTFADKQPARTLRFVAFVNEEKPFAQTPRMGSVVYAARSRARGENIVAMLSLETMGYYSNEKNSQRYPSVLRFVYPSAGNFIGFVGNVSSGPLVREAIGSFRREAKFPSEGGALPAELPGIGWSDHWAFWQQGYEAIMITDTAPFRYPYYHTAQDTPDKIDYDKLARVVGGLEAVVGDLVKTIDRSI